jgi:hypothetical protein
MLRVESRLRREKNQRNLLLPLGEDLNFEIVEGSFVHLQIISAKAVYMSDDRD